MSLAELLGPQAVIPLVEVDDVGSAIASLAFGGGFEEVDVDAAPVAIVIDTTAAAGHRLAAQVLAQRGAIIPVQLLPGLSPSDP